MSKVCELFVGVSNFEIDRPHDDIDVLIESNYSEMQTNEGLQLLESVWSQHPC